MLGTHKVWSINAPHFAVRLRCDFSTVRSVEIFSQGRVLTLTFCKETQITTQRPIMQQPAYPQPEWNTPDSVSMALEAATNARDKESSQSAYNKFLYSIGNNHAGTYYPVVLTTFTDIEAILRFGKSWPQRTVIEALIDLLISFEPEPGQEVFRDHLLSEAVRERIFGLKQYFLHIATGNDVAAASAKDILKHMDEEAEQVVAHQPA